MAGKKRAAVGGPAKKPKNDEATKPKAMPGAGLAAVAAGEAGLGACVALSNGVLMPWVGFGTYKFSHDKAKAATASAIRTGYRLVDTAYVYGGEKTEAEVGKAAAPADVFLTTKHWRKFHGYEQTGVCLRKSLERLGRIDLYLMHWPGPGYWAMGRSKAVIEEKGASHYFTKYDGKAWTPELRLETWRAMEDAYEAGLCRAIGVSNFTVEHLEHLLKHCRIVPHVNQVELHPYNWDPELVAFCQKKGIVVTAYASLGGQDAKVDLRGDPVVAKVAAAHGRTASQVLLRWALQHNLAVIPKASSAEHQRENTQLFDFRLSTKEVAELDALSKNKRQRLTWLRDPMRDEAFC